MIERCADIVGHATVDGHVLANARKRLQDAHRVKRNARHSHHRTTRLAEQAWLGKGELGAILLHGRGDHFSEFIDRRGVLFGGVGNAQTAAHIDLAHFDAVVALNACREFDDDLDGFVERVQCEDLRANVHVEAYKIHVRKLKNVGYAVECEIFAHGEAELRVFAARADVFVRISLDTWRDTHVDILRLAQLACDLGDAACFDARIDHDAPYACRNGFAQFLGSLVVAMHEHALHGEINGLRQRQLAAARHIEAETVRVHKATDRLVPRTPSKHR